MTAKWRKYSIIISISIENDYNLIERGFSRSCRRMGRRYWINVSAHFTNRAITSDRQSPVDSEGYTSLPVLSCFLTNIRMISETIASGPLLAQAMDSTEFRKGNGCDPCLFEALAGPETSRASLDKNHPNLFRLSD